MHNNFLNNKFDLLDKRGNRYILILTIFIYSVVFLNLFRPWNIARWYSDSGINQFLRLSSYGVIVSSVFLFTQFPLRKVFRITQFKVKTYLLWLLVEIILINLAYIFLYGNPLGNFINDLIFSVKYTLPGIFLPYSFGILIIYYKKHKAEIATLKSKIKQPDSGKLLALRDENNKVKFSVLSKDLLFLESADNYVSVYYFQKGRTERILIRNTLKSMEEKLKSNSIIRCHRSFILNMQNVEFIRKEGKKMLIKIKGVDRDIPVSKNYSPLFIDFLSQ